MSADAGDSWNKLARTKLTKVLGPLEADRLMSQALANLHLSALANADDLHRFAGELTGKGGFTAAVGAMLSLTAVLRGAHPGPAPVRKAG